jgi:hypothetical protein
MMTEKVSDVISQLSSFPENRFAALEEAQRLVCFAPHEWAYFLKILQKADGWLSFTHGPWLTIMWSRHEEDDKLHLTLEFRRHSVERGVTYTFSLSELAALGKHKRLKADKPKR